MANLPNDARAADEDLTAAASLSELNTQLYQAYLAGDGAAVERVMVLIEANQRAMLPVT